MGSSWSSWRPSCGDRDARAGSPTARTLGTMTKRRLDRARRGRARRQSWLGDRPRRDRRTAGGDPAAPSRGRGRPSRSPPTTRRLRVASADREPPPTATPIPPSASPPPAPATTAEPRATGDPRLAYAAFLLRVNDDRATVDEPQRRPDDGRQRAGSGCGPARIRRHPRLRRRRAGLAARPSAGRLLRRGPRIGRRDARRLRHGRRSRHRLVGDRWRHRRARRPRPGARGRTGRRRMRSRRSATPSRRPRCPG